MSEQQFSLTLSLQQDYQFQVDFGKAGVAPLLVDEPEPLGHGAGPNPTRLLGAAVGSCLGASLLFCLNKARISPAGLRIAVEGTVARNPEGRLRVASLTARLSPEVTPEERARMGRCLEVFEQYCTVTESVRHGIDVTVEVEPVETAAAAPA